MNSTALRGAAALLLSASAARADGLLLDEDFIDEVFAPVHHTHFSGAGTPYVHPFTLEPPQIHQDAFFIYKFTENTAEGSDEFEAEAHLDWALTKRIGFVFAAPLVGNREADGTHNVGMGDLEIAPRVMWIEQDYFILASNFFITVPTGDENRDLGAGEVTLAPFITTWHDLGDWNTLLLNFGPEIGVDSGSTSMIYSFSLTHSWLGESILDNGGHQWHDEHADDDDHPEHEHNGHDHARHFSPGMKTIYLELNGETPLDDSNAPTLIELLPGFSYVLAESAEVRFGILFPVTETKRFDRQYFASFTWIY